MSEGTVVTFYSYKGGVGRTLALANIGALLCRWGYKALCIDWDLEAPGLHLYFKPWMEAQDRPGLTDLLHDYINQKNPVWQDYATPVLFPDTAQPLSLITAGRQGGSYVQDMQSLEWKKLYDEHNLGGFIEDLRNQWKEAYDFILVDSRTGITDAGGICTVQLPDLLVLLFTANEQSLYGALDVVERAKQIRDSLPFDRAKLLVLPVAMRFEARVEYEMAQQWLGKFAEALAPLYAEWAHKDTAAADLLNYTRVPYIPYWSFGEKLPVIDKGTADPEDIGYSLEALAALVAQRFAHSDLLLRNRDSFVAGAASRAAAEEGGAQAIQGVAPKPRLFVSYSHKDRKYFEELASHLAILERQGVIGHWHEKVIAPGEVWDAAISAQIEEADIILALVSADWLASAYVSDMELTKALERSNVGQAVIIPVIIRACDWTQSQLGLFHALPYDGKPIASMTNPDEAWLQVVKGIQSAAEQLYQPKLRDRILINYSSRDTRWLNQLKLHLKPLVRERQILFLDNTQSLREERARRLLGSTRLVILLVSPSFLASDVIWNEQMPLLLHAAKSKALKILWIPVSFSAYEDTPIRQFQALHPPAEPLDALRSSSRRDKALVDISKKIKEALLAPR